MRQSSLVDTLNSLGFQTYAAVDWPTAPLDTARPAAAYATGERTWDSGLPCTQVELRLPYGDGTSCEVPDDACGRAFVALTLNALNALGFTAAADSACNLGNFNVLDS